MTETMTRDMALAYLRRAVDEKGADFVYKEHYDDMDGCRYSVGDQPACIVGLVLYYHTGEVPFTAPSEQDNQSETILDLANAGVIKFPIHDDAVHVLRQAQSQQDVGVSWGQALAQVESGVRND